MRPRLTFETPLTRDEARVFVTGRIGSEVIDEKSRLAGVKAAIRAIARETFIRRRDLHRVQHDRCRYIYRRLREAWVEALVDAGLGLPRVDRQTGEMRGSDGGIVRSHLRLAEDQLHEVRLLVAMEWERAAADAEQQEKVARSTARARSGKAAIAAERRDDVLRKARDLRSRNPTLYRSNASVARKLAPETELSERQISRILGEKK